MRRLIKDHAGGFHHPKISRADFKSAMKAHHDREDTQPAQAAAEVTCCVNPQPRSGWWNRCFEYITVVPIAVGALTAAVGFVAGAAAVACLPAIALMYALGAGWPYGVAFTIGLALPVLALRSYLQAPQNRAYQLAEIGRCGACGYRLDKLSPDSCGMIRCPECSASWRPTGAAAMCCPFCTHSLTGTPMPENGVLECPECQTSLRVLVDAGED